MLNINITFLTFPLNFGSICGRLYKRAAAKQSNDMIDPWRRLEYHPTFWSREQVEGTAVTLAGSFDARPLEYALGETDAANYLPLKEVNNAVKIYH